MTLCHHDGSPVLRTYPCVCVLSPLIPVEPLEQCRSFTPKTAAFPVSLPGQLPQLNSRDLYSAFTHVTAHRLADPLKGPFS